MVQHTDLISISMLPEKAIDHFFEKILTQNHLLKYGVDITSIT